MTTRENKLHFVKNFFRDYRVAAFSPSSEFLTRAVLNEIDNNLKIVIEQGPGSGVMTKAILSKLPACGKLILVEQNAQFLAVLRKIDDPRIIIFEGTIQEFKYSDILQPGEKANLIVSSIPFSFLQKNERDLVCKQACENLDSKGKFIIFHQYSPLMRRHLSPLFAITRIKFIFRNIFPCFIVLGVKV